MLHSLLTLLFAFPSPTADYAAIVASFLQPRRALLKPALLLAALKAACIDTSNPVYITHVLRVLSLLIESCDALFSCLLVNHFVLSRLLRFFRSNPADALAVPAVKCALSIVALERRFHPRASCAFAFSVLNEMVTVRILAEVKPALDAFSLTPLLDSVLSPPQVAVEKALQLLQLQFEENWEIVSAVLKKQDGTRVERVEESACHCLHRAVVHSMLYGEWMTRDDLTRLTELIQQLFSLAHHPESLPLGALFREMNELPTGSSFHSLLLLFFQSCARWVESRLDAADWQPLFLALQAMLTNPVWNTLSSEEWSRYPLSFSFRTPHEPSDSGAPSTPSEYTAASSSAEQPSCEQCTSEGEIRSVEMLVWRLWELRDASSTLLSAFSPFVASLLQPEESTHHRLSVHYFLCLLLYEALLSPDPAKSGALLRRVLTSSSHDSHSVVQRAVILALNTLRAPMVSLPVSLQA